MTKMQTNRARRVRSGLAAVLGAAALSLVTPGCFDEEWRTIDEETVVISPEDTAGIDRVDLQAEDGVIDVVAEDRETILVDVRYRGYLEEECHHDRRRHREEEDAIRDGLVFDAVIVDDTLELSTVTVPDGRIDLSLRVPRGVRVDVAAMTDDVEVHTDDSVRVQVRSE